MRFDEAEGFGPEGRDRFRFVIEIDGEAVSFVVVRHISENIIVDIAKKMYFRLDSPVIPHVLEGRVVVKEPAIPSTHLMIGDQVPVLDFLLLEYLAAFLEQVVVYPGGHGPVFFRDELVIALRVGFGAGAALEVFGEGDVVEEGPGIVEFVVPGSLEVFHRLDHAFDFFVADEREDCGVDAGGIGVVGGVVVCSPEFAGGLVGFYYLCKLELRKEGMRKCTF